MVHIEKVCMTWYTYALYLTNQLVQTGAATQLVFAKVTLQPQEQPYQSNAEARTWVISPAKTGSHDDAWAKARYAPRQGHTTGLGLPRDAANTTFGTELGPDSGGLANRDAARAGTAGMAATPAQPAGQPTRLIQTFQGHF